MKMATEKYIPYGRQQVDEADIAAVVEVLRSDWLTTGPKVAEFEGAIADYVGCRYAVAVSSGTAALHAAVAAIGVGPGDEVVLPPLTFVATANAVLYQGATPVFADVDAATLLLDPEQVEAKITPRTKAIIAVDYAGQPCDYEALSDIAERHQLRLLADASHSLGAKWQGRKVGSLADLSTFSFHPVKSITCGEGGMVTTDDLQLAQWLRQFRNHGIDVDHRQRAANGTWHYQMCNLGFNYRLSDLHCSLGVSQLGKLPGWISRRQEIAAEYNRCFADHAGIEPLVGNADTSHSYHLYVVRVVGADRDLLLSRLRESGIGANVHYLPVYQHEYYRAKFVDYEGSCLVAEQAFGEILSLPIFPAMTNEDVRVVVEAIRKNLPV